MVSFCACAYYLLSLTPCLPSIEFNPTMPNDIIYIPPRNDTIRHGASLSALHELLEKEYILIETTTFNAFFLSKEIYHKYNFKTLAPYSTIEELHECTMTTALYQLYDGTLKLHGCKKLLWHGMGIKEEDIQILKRDEDRFFPFAPSNQSEVTLDNHGSIIDLAIDISSFFTAFDPNSPSAEQMQCSIQFIQTLQKYGGFVYIKLPNNSTEKYSNGIKATKRFFSTPNEQIRRSCLSKDRAKRGYSPRNTENFASLIGESGVRNDLVRKFRVGPPDPKETSSLYTPNTWPDESLWSDVKFFQDSIEGYYKEMNNLANILLHIIHIGLVHEYPFLEPFIESLISSDLKSNNETSSILTLLNYTRGSRHKIKKKNKNTNEYYYPHPLVAEHTDVGMFTILSFDQGDCATLQRKATSSDKEQNEDEWINVTLPPINNDKDSIYFVVNIGDCLSKLTKSYAPSTLHRVIPRDGYKERNCLAYFVGLHSNSILKLPIEGKDGNGSGYRTMTFEEWRKERICNVMKVLSSSKD